MNFKKLSKIADSLNGQIAYFYADLYDTLEVGSRDYITTKYPKVDVDYSKGNGDFLMYHYDEGHTESSLTGFKTQEDVLKAFKQLAKKTIEDISEAGELDSMLEDNLIKVVIDNQSVSPESLM